MLTKKLELIILRDLDNGDLFEVSQLEFIDDVSNLTKRYEFGTIVLFELALNSSISSKTIRFINKIARPVLWHQKHSPNRVLQEVNLGKLVKLFVLCMYIFSLFLACRGEEELILIREKSELIPRKGVRDVNNSSLKDELFNRIVWESDDRVLRVIVSNYDISFVLTSTWGKTFNMSVNLGGL